jgi:hypothetical protein
VEEVDSPALGGLTNFFLMASAEVLIDRDDEDDDELLDEDMAADMLSISSRDRMSVRV